MTDKKISSKLKILNAEYGDCFILSVTDGENTANILIDSGPNKSYLDVVKPELENLEFDLCIITHFDEDHSKGLAIYLSEDINRISKIHKYWINSPSLIEVNDNPEVSPYSTCNSLSKLFERYEKENNCKVDCHEEVTAGKIYCDPKGLFNITVLSPTKESKRDFLKNYTSRYSGNEVSGTSKKSTLDRTLEDWAKTDTSSLVKGNQTVNDSSISCLIKTEDKTYLMLGDTREEIILPWLKKYKEMNGYKLKVDYMKIPHHGSMYNMTEAIFNYVECSNFIISTNGRYGLPDRAVIAKILMSVEPSKRDEIKLFFNYESSKMEDNGAYFLTEEEIKSGLYNFIIDLNKVCQ